VSGVGNHLGIAFAQIADRAALQRLSRTDELTGVLNRRAFLEDLERRLAHLARMNRSAALFYVDLDNFKAVNDERGHAAGDSVLRTLADLLRRESRAGDLVARLGGDEFALWIEELDEPRATATATTLLASAAALAPQSARAAPLGISVGAALSDAGDGKDLEGLIARADQAMYPAKRSGKGTYAIVPGPAARGSGGVAAMTSRNAARGARPAAPGPAPAYDDAKEIAAAGSVAERHGLATRADTEPEILYYLAEDAAPEVRRAIAANRSTPPQADVILAHDADDEVRCDLALKIARVLPHLPPQARSRVRDLTTEALDVLAGDQLPRVRRILAEELKNSRLAPVAVVERLARDLEEIVAAPILEYSPLLSDDVLVEIVTKVHCNGAPTAIARRRTVSARVSDAIVASDDVPAVAALLANPSAQIREETLDQIIERAPKREAWHEPLVRRDDLGPRALRRVAGFVASSLLISLRQRGDLDEETAKAIGAAVHRRIEDESPPDVTAPEARARQLHASGALDDALIAAEIRKKDHEFVTFALARMAGAPAAKARCILESRSGKSVVALAWAAGLSMRTATLLQRSVARVPPHGLVKAQKNNEYPFTPDEMSWHIEFFDG